MPECRTDDRGQRGCKWNNLGGSGGGGDSLLSSSAGPRTGPLSPDDSPLAPTPLEDDVPPDETTDNRSVPRDTHCTEWPRVTLLTDEPDDEVVHMDAVDESAKWTKGETCCRSGCSTRALRTISPFVGSGDSPLRLESEGQVATPDEFVEQSDRAADDVTHSVDRDMETTE